MSDPCKSIGILEAIHIRYLLNTSRIHEIVLVVNGQNWYVDQSNSGAVLTWTLGSTVELTGYRILHATTPLAVHGKVIKSAKNYSNDSIEEREI